MKLNRFGASLGVIAALSIGVAGVRAAYIVKDGAGAMQTFASFITGAEHWPAHVMGGLFGGVPTATTMTNTGQLDVNPVNVGQPSDAAWSGSGPGSLIAIAKKNNADMNGSTPAGSADIGFVGLQAHSTGGCTPKGFQSAASTNATSVTSVATTFCGGVAINTTATLYYLRFYDSATSPTCSSATNFIATVPIPASTSGNGTLLNIGGTFGAAFVNGLAWCLTGGGTSTDNTSAATGVFISYGVK